MSLKDLESMKQSTSNVGKICGVTPSMRGVHLSTSCDLLFVNQKPASSNMSHAYFLSSINAVKCWCKKQSIIISMVFIKNHMSDSPFEESIEDKSVVL